MLTPRMRICRILVPVLKWEHETGPLNVFTWRHSNHVPKQRNGQPCWCSQLILREFHSILMQTFSLSFCFSWKTCSLITWVKTRYCRSSTSHLLIWQLQASWNIHSRTLLSYVFYLKLQREAIHHTPSNPIRQLTWYDKVNIPCFRL